VIENSFWRCRPLALWAAMLALAGCALTDEAPSPDLQITGTRIENRSQGWLAAVRLIVPATGNFVSCGNIAPQGECSTRFPEQTYSGNPVEVSWSQGGEIWSTGLLELQPDAAVLDAGAALVQVVIVGPGRAGVALLPVTGAEVP